LDWNFRLTLPAAKQWKDKKAEARGFGLEVCVTKRRRLWAEVPVEYAVVELPTSGFGETHQPRLIPAVSEDEVKAAPITDFTGPDGAYLAKFLLDHY
jgi:hypothetical protein